MNPSKSRMSNLLKHCLHTNKEDRYLTKTGATHKQAINYLLTSLFISMHLFWLWEQWKIFNWLCTYLFVGMVPIGTTALMRRSETNLWELVFSLKREAWDETQVLRLSSPSHCHQNHLFLRERTIIIKNTLSLITIHFYTISGSYKFTC